MTSVFCTIYCSYIWRGYRARLLLRKKSFLCRRPKAQQTTYLSIVSLHLSHIRHNGKVCIVFEGVINIHRVSFLKCNVVRDVHILTYIAIFRVFCTSLCRVVMFPLLLCSADREIVYCAYTSTSLNGSFMKHHLPEHFA